MHSLRSLFAAALLALTFTAGAQADSVKTTHSNTVYAQPSASAKVVGLTPENQWMQVEGSAAAEDGQWYEVSVAGKNGWVPASVTQWRIEDAPITHPKLSYPKAPNCSKARSRSVGSYGNGHLYGGVLMPASSPDFFQWNFRDQKIGGANATHWGNCKMVVAIMRGIRAYRKANPDAPMVAIGDLGLRRGGDINHHSTHENGLAVDIYYPRKDKLKMEPHSLTDVDRRLSRKLVATMLRYGAKKALVGYNSGVPTSKRVHAYPKHEDHVHLFF